MPTFFAEEPERELQDAPLMEPPADTSRIDGLLVTEETAEEKQQPGVLIPGDRLVHDFIHTAVKAMDVDLTFV